MKTFKFKFSKSILILSYIALALCVAGLGINFWRILQYGASTTYDYVQYGVIFFVSIFFPILLISMLLSSGYDISNDELITRFGIIKTKYRLDTITSVALLQKKSKISISFVNNSYIVISVNEEWNHEFIAALRENHPNIEVQIISDEEK